MTRIVAVLITGTLISAASFAGDRGRMLSDKEAKQLAATATAPADHMRLAEHFQLKAAKLEAEAKEHAQMAENYRTFPTASETKRPGAVDTVSHCEALSQDLAKAAKDARALAIDHAAMAKKQ